MKDSFYRPAEKLRIINKVKDSKFYGSIASVSSKQDADEFIVKIKNEFHDATHNVYAYKIASGDLAVKYSDDDGEPAGSSGPPVLQAIEGADLTNTVIVVTRYFGGTKLGIGGLIRAYGETAAKVISASGREKLLLYKRVLISTGYDFIGISMGQIEACNGDIQNTEYSNNGIGVEILIRPESFKSLQDRLIKMTGNKIDIKVLEIIYK